MNKKIRITLTLSFLVVILTFSVLGIMFILETSYRKSLPDYPDFKMLSRTVREQIKSAGLKAYLNPSTDNMGHLGMVYQSSAIDDKAAVCYQLAVKRDHEEHKRAWRWSYYLGYLNLEQGESKSAIENFGDVLQKNPGNYMALFYIGDALQNLGKTNEAKNIFKRIAAANLPDNRQGEREYSFPLQTYSMFRLGRIYLNSNQLDSAEIVLKQTIGNWWTFGPAYRLLGDVYIKGGKTEEGKHFIDRSNDVAPYTAPADTLLDQIALLSRSDAYLLKQIEVAKMNYNFKWEQKLCNHAIEFIPDNKYLLSNTILLDFVLGKEKEVLPLLDQHFKGFQDDFDELLKLADFLYGKGFESQAMRYFNQAKKLQPNASRLAIWLQERGKNEEALALLNDQLKKDPENESVLTDAVHLFLNLGEKDKVLVYLEKLNKRNPSNIEARKAMGRLLEIEGKNKEALAVYETIAKNKPKDLAIYRYVASMYYNQKMWDKAILNFKLALDDFPNDPDFMDELGRLEITCPEPRLRNVPEGREYCERVYLSSKSSPPTRILAAKNLATAYAMLGDRPMAFQYINITMNMANQMGEKVNLPPQDLAAYFQNLENEYHLN